MSKQDNNSLVDDLYFRLYGEHQTKEGQALERLSAVAFKLLEEERKVRYDQQVRAPYSGTVYQVDGLLGEGNRQTMIEAKDYTVGGEKVGRADLQKLEGALTDLDIPEGRFVSATDYTNRAKPYAKSTEINPKQNLISLYHIRPSTAEDEKERIKSIVITIVAHGLEFEKGKYQPLINSQYFESIKDKLLEKGEKQKVTLCQFFDAEGNVVETLGNITLQLNSRLPKNADKGYILKGKWEFSQSVYIDMIPLGRVLIDSILYEIPTYTDECTFTVDQKGNPALLIKSEDGIVDKLFTDHQLRQFKFDAGEIKKK